jgi:hypothetical protein
MSADNDAKRQRMMLIGQRTLEETTKQVNKLEAQYGRKLSADEQHDLMLRAEVKVRKEYYAEQNREDMLIEFYEVTGREHLMVEFYREVGEETRLVELYRHLGREQDLRAIYDGLKIPYPDTA